MFLIVQEWNSSMGEIHDSTDIITVASTEIVSEAIKPMDSVLGSQQADAMTATQQTLNRHADSQADAMTATQQALNRHTDSPDVAAQQQTEMDSTHDTDLLNLRSNAEVQLLKSTQCHVSNFFTSLLLFCRLLSHDPVGHSQWWSICS